MNYFAAAQEGFATVDVPEEIRHQALEHLRQWLTGSEFAPYRPQLEGLIEQRQWAGLVDRFYQILPFGTGGRRGPVGVGPNRMNPWTLRASVQGHCEYLKERFPGVPKLLVVLAYDVRRFTDQRHQYSPARPNPLLGMTSKSLAHLAAEVYAGNGIQCLLPSPDSTRYLATPELSFAIRRYKAHGGLNLSASHNPPDDNGGKFYNEYGAQPVAPDDQIMADLVDEVTTIRSLPWNDAVRQGYVTFLDDTLHQAYLDLICHQSLLGPLLTNECSIVFTPLHGVGGFTVKEVLERQKFTVVQVPEQAEPNGLFPHVASPNPEVPASMDMAAALASKVNADMVLASDPDADRLGAMIPRPGGWRFLTGNEIIALATHFKLEQLAIRGQLPQSPLVITTEVTTRLVTQIGWKFGCQVVNDLPVGFKFMGDVLAHLERTGRYRDVEARPEDMILACEESHGIMCCPQLRDKDAAGGALWLAELAAHQKRRGLTVLAYLEHLYREFGYFVNLLRNLVMVGVLGKQKMQQMLDSLRNDPPTEIAGRKIETFTDLLSPDSVFGPLKGETDRLSRNVLLFQLEGNARIALRPSGTEPKAKAYIEIASDPCPPQRPTAVWEKECRALDQEGERLAEAFVKLALGRVGESG
jgi:phosphoglucomutase/phosphomannomutase